MRDKEHEAFLGRAMNFIRKLLKNQMGLQHRLLGRIKSNYQLSMEQFGGMVGIFGEFGDAIY